jgi:hypothetical protein
LHRFLRFAQDDNSDKFDQNPKDLTTEVSFWRAKLSYSSQHLSSPTFAFSTLALAEGTRTWEQSKFDELTKGTPKGIALRSQGGLELAPAFKSLATTPSTYIWSIASDSAGNIYAAAGSPARVYRITPDGQTTTIFEPQELQVQALVVDKSRHCLCGDRSRRQSLSPRSGERRQGPTPKPRGAQLHISIRSPSTSGISLSTVPATSMSPPATTAKFSKSGHRTELAFFQKR